ncbi:hypothetical protein PV08_01220 [Exophiala spinifera]|uniref:BD-FAE-like domain-containing protein n=1 Tax=Exophiala spinifera TaxID=91928 RepID=A0A0D2BP07_9EURO|nr:uncharacterized protein PV08_01220 [Exophiala spinifera]KIW20643.1 hypothetical protein PV08_01220 [Exophiala spinifera]
MSGESEYRPAHRSRWTYQAQVRTRSLDSIPPPTDSISLETAARQERAQKGPRRILVHLPPGPSLRTPAHDVQPQLRTLLSPNTSIVTVHYRLGLANDATTEETTCFPTPIHDVSTALEYLTSSTSPFNDGQHEAPRICLLGSHIGGALATMLALTQPNDVHALAAIEPLVDWVSLDEIVEQFRPIKDMARKRQKYKATRFGIEDGSILAAAEDLVKLRAKLFPTPSSYFDPFASPLLFLRAPGRDTPLSSTVGDELVEEMGLNEHDGGFVEFDYPEDPLQEEHSLYARSTNSPLSPRIGSTGSSEDPVTGSSSADTAPTSVATQPQSPPRRRKVLQRWPSIGRPESVLLPYVKVFVQSPPVSLDKVECMSDEIRSDLGHTALMRAQGKELVELMRRACFFGREKGFAEERVQLSEGIAHDEDRWRGDVESHPSTRRLSMHLQEQALGWAEAMLAKE